MSDVMDETDHDTTDLPSEPVEGEAPAAPGPSDVGAESIVEAILFATDTPLPAAKIAQVLDDGDAKTVKKLIEQLNARYEQNGHAFRIDEIAGGFQMLSLPVYNHWLSRLLRAKQETRLSAAAMETLAIIAYKQPVLRADVESIRGVAAGDIINRLREMNLVKIVGRAEEIGRPMLYGTTKRFLEVFGLSNLDDLPNVEALNSGASAKPSGNQESESSDAVQPSTDAGDE